MTRDGLTRAERLNARHGRRRRTSFVALLVSVGLIVTAGSAVAFWAVGGNGAATADSLANGTQPVLTGVSAQNVTIHWNASTTVTTGVPVTGYTINRYAAASGGSPTAATGGCVGVIATLSCTEQNVPVGTWYYAVTPHLANWVGTEGLRSLPIPVSAGASKLAFTTAPQTFLKGNPTGGGSGTITVQIQDASNSAVPAASPVTVALPAVSGVVFSASYGGSSTGTLTIPAGSSSANFFMTSSGTGSIVITATSSGLTSATQTETVVSAATLPFTTVSVPSQSPSTLSATQAATYSVTITNGFLSGTTRDFAITSVNGLPPGSTWSVTSPACKTIAYQVIPALSATFTLTVTTSAATLPGSSTFVVVGSAFGTANGSCGGTASDNGQDNGTLNVASGVPAKIVFTTHPSTTKNGSSIAPAVTAAVQDAAGNVVTISNAPVTVALGNAGTNPGGGSLSGTVTVNAVAGIATFNNLSINTPGAGYTLTASSAGLASGTSNAFTVYGAAAKLVFTQQPGNALGGAVLSTQPKVTVVDANGYTVLSDSSTVALTITSGTGTSGAVLSGCAGVESLGVVTFSGCKIDKSGTNYQLHATDGALTSADSSAFNISVGAANKLVFTQSPAGASAAAAFTTQPKVAILDAGGNVVTTDSSTVALTITSGTGTTGAALTTCSGIESLGVVSFSGCKIDKSGSNYQLHATDGALTAADSTAFTVTAGPLASFVVSVTGTKTAGTAFTATVSAIDAGGNPATGWTSTTGCVTFSGAANSPGGNAPIYPAVGSCGAGNSSLSFNSVGQATASITLFNASSSTILTVKDPPGATHSGASAAFAVDSKGVTLAFSPALPQTVARNSSKAFTITVPVDQYGNAFTSAAGVAVALTLDPSSGSWGFTSSTSTNNSTKTVTIATGGGGSGFSVFAANSGTSGRTATLSASTSAGFTAPASGTLTTT